MATPIIIPALQASVVCEDVRQENNGMQTLVGVLNVLPATNLPVGLLKMAVWTRWIGGVGQFNQKARILTPNQTVLAETEVDFELHDTISQATNVNFFAGIQFKEFGTYSVEILLKGEEVIRYPIHVVQVQQQQNP